MALTYTRALAYFTFAFSHPSFCAFLLVYLLQSITQHSQLLFTTCEIQACSLFPLWPLFLHTPFTVYLLSPLGLLHWLCSGTGWGQHQTKCFSEFQENQKLFIVSVQIITCICHLLKIYQCTSFFVLSLLAASVFRGHHSKQTHSRVCSGICICTPDYLFILFKHYFYRQSH